VQFIACKHSIQNGLDVKLSLVPVFENIKNLSELDHKLLTYGIVSLDRQEYSRFYTVHCESYCSQIFISCKFVQTCVIYYCSKHSTKGETSRDIESIEKQTKENEKEAETPAHASRAADFTASGAGVASN